MCNISKWEELHLHQKPNLPQATKQKMENICFCLFPLTKANSIKRYVITSVSSTVNFLLELK